VERWKSPFLFTPSTGFYKQLALDNQPIPVYKKGTFQKKGNNKQYKLWISINIGKVIGKLPLFLLSQKQKRSFKHLLEKRECVYCG